MPSFRNVVILMLSVMVSSVMCGSKNKPHGHKGVLDHYTGKLLPFKISAEQSKKLDSGEPVTLTEGGGGKSGRGLVIQDVNATTSICMSRIRDLPNYPKMVPHVKKVGIYESVKFNNGTSKTGAQFDIGLLGFKFTYFLKLTHEPRFNTLTWTLDYTKNSDFDDNVGHWQVMNHPSKIGWTRVLYSTKVKLFPWIPSFVVSFITTKALVESTTWVKKESEIEQAKASALNANPADQFKKMLPSWMVSGGFQQSIQNMQDKASVHAKNVRQHSMQPFIRLRTNFKGF